MPFTLWENVVLITAVALEATLLIALLRRDLGRVYPSFFLYLCFNLLEDPSGLAIRVFSSHLYDQFYFVATVLDYVLQLLVLWEMARNVFRPTKKLIGTPLRKPAFLLICIAAVCIVFVVGGPHLSPALSRSVSFGTLEPLIVRISLVLAVLKILLFVALAAFAQFLGIGWRNHVLQLATGFAFYGAISLSVQLSSSHLPAGPLYLQHIITLNTVQAAAYLATLLFWIWAFSRNDAPRKDFTPQMQEVLVTIAQSAKRTRLAVTRGSEHR
jgi:hypothetical protein